jgi:arsenate reductase
MGARLHGDVQRDRVDESLVLFVCAHNWSRRQIAEPLFNSRTNGRAIAGSAGTEPAESISPLAPEAMREMGVDLSAPKPAPGGEA